MDRKKGAPVAFLWATIGLLICAENANSQDFNLLAAAGTTGLVSSGFELNMFDGSTSTCTTGNPIVIELNQPIVLGAVAGVYFKAANTTQMSQNLYVVVEGGPKEGANDGSVTQCGTGIGQQQFTLNPLGTFPGTYCPSGIYTDRIVLQSDDGADFLACEVAIIGWEQPTAIDPDNVNRTYFFTVSNNEWVPYLKIRWPTLEEPTCPKTILNKDFGAVGTTVGDGTIVFEGYESVLDIFDVENMAINVGGVYNVSLQRIFVDGAAYFGQGALASIPGEIQSDVASLSVSRSAICWVGACEESENDEQCSARFNLQSPDVQQTEWLPVMGLFGVCFVTVVYTQDNRILEYPKENYLGALQAQDANPTENVDQPGIANDVFFEGQSNCYYSCAAALIAFNPPDNLTDFPVNIGQTQCSWAARNFCCDTDWCFEPEVFDTNPTFIFNSQCVNILRRENPQAWENMDFCLFPAPTHFVQDSMYAGERGEIHFQVHPDVTNFTSINMELYSASSSTTPIREGDVCTPSVAFAGGANHFCTVHNLRPNTVYYVKLQGYNSALDNLAAGGQANGLTAWSYLQRIETGDTLTLDCQLNSFVVGFKYDDVYSSNPTQTVTEVQAWSGGTNLVFDSQDVIQTQYGGTEPDFIIDRDQVLLFRGYPSAVIVQSDTTQITHIAFSYSFQTDQVIYGPQGTYNSVTPNTFSLVNERIFRVTGSFSSAGVLAAIAFSKRDDSGAEVTSTCYGTGDCTGFSVTQTTGNQYVTSMFGATDTSGVIRALSFRWASMSFQQYTLRDTSCVIDVFPDWNDIKAYTFNYTATPSSSCGSTRTIDDDQKLVNYTNGIGQGDGSGSTAGEVVTGNGVSIVRQSSSGFSLVCCYHTRGNVTSQFETEAEDSQSAMGVNRVPYKLSFYTNAAFTTAFGADSVVNVLLDAPFYFGVTFEDDNPAILGGMTIYAPECWATQTSSSDKIDGSYFTLEQNGCPTDFDTGAFERYETVRSDSGNTIDPLSYRAFAWESNAAGVVYIHCTVKGCISDNANECIASTTNNSCSSTGRARRAVDSGVTLPEMTITSQPLFVARPKRHITLESQRESFLGAHASQLAISFVGGMMLLLVKTGFSWAKQRRGQRNNHIQ